MRSSNRTPDGPSTSNKRWLLRQVSLFKNLTDEHLGLVAERTRLVEYEKDEILYRQGDPADCLYGIVSGRIRILIRQGDRLEPVEILHRGDYFGIASLLTNEPHSVTTQAANDSILFKIRKPDFEEILKRVPEIAIHLSTTLSRRLRQREAPAKRVFESTLISLYSALPDAGRTTYAVNLATSLRKETGKNVLLMELSSSGESVCQALGMGKPAAPIHLKGTGFEPTRIGAAIVSHPPTGLDYLGIAHDPRVAFDVTQITPLLSHLATLYHFVVIDLPSQMDRTVFKTLVQSDGIHLVCSATRAHLEATASLLKELQRSIQQADQRIKVVMNEFAREVSESEQTDILQYRIYATLPAIRTPPAPGHPVVLAHPDWIMPGRSGGSAGRLEKCWWGWCWAPEPPWGSLTSACSECWSGKRSRWTSWPVPRSERSWRFSGPPGTTPKLWKRSPISSAPNGPC